MYVGEGRDDEFHLTFDFELLHSPWDCRHLALAIERAEARLPAHIMPTYQISNHDQSRHATRWGERRTRAAAFLLLTLRDVAVLYAGEEIGMVDADESHAPDRPIDRFGRDPERTPMQWDASPTGGFTTGEPWLPLVDPATRNVAAQAADPASLLALYRRLIATRRGSPALRRGTPSVAVRRRARGAGLGPPGRRRADPGPAQRRRRAARMRPAGAARRSPARS